MNADVVYRKTQKGVDEVERRVYRLAVKERLLLILVDGKRSVREISGRERDWGDVATKLLADGYIELAPPTRMTIPLRERPQPPAAAPMPPRAATPAQPRTAAPTGTPNRNWLTNTMSQLSEFFTSGLQDAPWSAPRKRASDDVIDITAALPTTRAEGGPPSAYPPAQEMDDHTWGEEPSVAASAMLSRDVARYPQAPNPAAPSPTPIPENWDDVPCIDLDGPFDAAPGKVAEPAPAPPPTALERVAPRSPTEAPRNAPVAAPPPRDETTDEPGKLPCCARCPGKSILAARDFMKRHLARLPAHPHGRTVLERLEQCRSATDLEELIEPWLRVLLADPSGVAETPRISTQLFRILRQSPA